jgi:nitrogen fixation/metabolism regulation signal transduction histidine kinase
MFWWNKLELEWKILILACLGLIAFAWPLNNFYLSRLSQTLQQSIDPQLETLLRSSLPAASEEQQLTIVASLERTRQWQALVPIIVREQRQSFFAISMVLFLVVGVAAFWTLRRLTRPLKQLAAAVRAIGRGEQTSVSIDCGGALGVLQSAVGTLQSELTLLRQQAQVQGMERAWQDIARVMAHEIKNPLTPIRLTLDSIEEKIALEGQLSSEKAQTLLSRINVQLDALERLVNQFRSFSKEPEAQCRPLRIDQSIQKTAMDLSSQLNTTLSGQARVQADPYLLEQVQLNIWKNALEAGAGAVRVSIVSQEHHCCITITDDGPGLPPDQLQQVWLPYVTTKKGGTGLGLPVVRKLIETMGGSVRLQSRNHLEQHGLSVIITLPLASQRE